MKNRAQIQLCKLEDRKNNDRGKNKTNSAILCLVCLAAFNPRKNLRKQRACQSENPLVHRIHSDTSI